jgi:hypothetical protein
MKGAGLRSFRPGSLGEGREFVSRGGKREEMERMNRVYFDVWTVTKGYQHVLVVGGPERVTREEMRKVIAKGLELDVGKVMELRAFNHPESGRVERVFGVKFEGRHEGLEEALNAGYVESETGDILRIRRYYMPVDPNVAIRELCIRGARGVEEKEVRKVIEAKIGGLQEGDQLFQRGLEWILRAATVGRAKKLGGVDFEWGAVGVHVKLDPVPLSLKRNGRSWTDVVRNTVAAPVKQGGQVDEGNERGKEEVDDGGKMDMKISPKSQPKWAKEETAKEAMAKDVTAQKPLDPGPVAPKERAGAGASAELTAMQEKYKEMEAKMETLTKQVQGIQGGVMEMTERMMRQVTEYSSRQMEGMMRQMMESMPRQMEEMLSKMMEKLYFDEVRARAQEATDRAKAQATAQEDARARLRAQREDQREEEARVRAQREEEARLRAQREAQCEEEARARAQREEEARAQAQREEEARVRAQQEARAQAQREEEAAQAQREEEARAQAQREEEARVRAQQEARAQAQRDEETRMTAQREEEARVRAVGEQRQKGRAKKAGKGKKGGTKTEASATEEDHAIKSGLKKSRREVERPSWIPNNLGATVVEASLVTMKEGKVVKEQKPRQSVGDWWIAGSVFGNELWAMTSAHQEMLWMSRLKDAQFRDGDGVLMLDMLKSCVTDDGLYFALEQLKVEEDQKDISVMEVDDDLKSFLVIKAIDRTDVDMFQSMGEFINAQREFPRHD